MLYPEFTELLFEYDIIGIVETKLDDLGVISLPVYEVICNNRKPFKRIGGYCSCNKRYFITPH